MPPLRRWRICPRYRLLHLHLRLHLPHLLRPSWTSRERSTRSFCSRRLSETKLGIVMRGAASSRPIVSNFISAEYGIAMRGDASNRLYASDLIMSINGQQCVDG